MFKMDFRKKITAFLVILSLLAVYAPTALFAADEPTVSVSHDSSSITTDSATITVDIIPNTSNNISGTVYCSKNSDATGGWSDGCSSGGTFNLSTLEPNTRYYYKAEITYDNSTLGAVSATLVSGIGSFTTKPPYAMPTVTTNQPTYDSATDTITVTGSAVEGTSAIIGRGFAYSYTTSMPVVGDGNKNVSLQGAFSASISASARTECYVRAYVVTSDDGMVYSTAAQHITWTTATPPKSTTNAVANIAMNTATAKVNVTNAGSLTITKVGVVYSTNSSEPNLYHHGTNVLFSEVSATGMGEVSIPLSNLTAGTKYYVRGYVVTPAGTHYSSTVVDFTTAAATPPVLTTDAMATVKATTATAKITISSVGSGFTIAGVVYSTNVNQLTVGSTGSSTASVGTNIVGSPTFNLTGLNPSTTYHVRGYVYAPSTTTYTYASNNPISFTTPAASAPSVAATSVNSYTDSSAVINLNVTGDGGSPILERGVVYSTSTSSPTIGGSTSTKRTASGTTGSTTVPITGLSSETTYYVRSYATNSVNTTYGTYASFKTTATQAANAPSVTTSSPASSSITSSSAEIPINITNSNGYTVTEYGVVYSRYKDNSSPTVGGSKCYTEYYTGSKSGSVTITLTGLDPDTEYAVRAYAKNSKGYGYGTVRTFTTDDDDGSPVVLTQSTSRVSDTEINVEIKVTSSYTITEKGVVYSRTNSSPKLNSSSTSKQEISGTSSGTSTVSLTGLISGSSYYVRAYATNRNGTSYGSVKEVTANDYTVTTNAVSDITPSSAIVGGTVSSSINSDVLERGVVYSRSSKSPTVNDTRVRSDRTTYGSYSLTLTGLGFNETYYVRAYIRTADGYSYGSTVTFSTNTNLTVTVLYKTEDGQQVGSQNITAAHNATITQTALNVPYGYTLVNSYYSYNVTATTSTTVLVRKTLQSAYMEGSSNYLFEPDKKITRIEVAKMIHSLKGNVYVGEGKTYHDMPTVQAELAALKYVTAMSYMVGDPDGKFRPYDPITRAEVVVICNTVYGLQSNDLTNPFSDIENHWAKNYIIIGYKNKALYGYPDGTFKPQANMTRAEAVIVFANAEKRDLTPLTTTPFSDVPASHWAYKYIMNAAIPKK